MGVISKIKKEILVQKVNVYEFSKAIGIGEKGMYQWTDESMKIATLLKVCEFFNKPVSYFLDENVLKTEQKTKNAKVQFDLESDDVLKIDIKNRKLEILKK